MANPSGGFALRCRNGVRRAGRAPKCRRFRDVLGFHTELTSPSLPI